MNPINFVKSKPSSRLPLLKIILWTVPIVIAISWMIVLTVLYVKKLRDSDNLLAANQIIMKCEQQSDCSLPTPHCDTEYSNQCSVCLNNDHCLNNQDNKKVCDMFGTRNCFECLQNVDCINNPSGLTYCESVETRNCVKCIVDSDCNVNAGDDKHCHENTCHECDVKTCASGACSGQDCLQCTKDEHCDGHMVCDTTRSSCYPCFDNNDHHCIKTGMGTRCLEELCYCDEPADCATGVCNTSGCAECTAQHLGRCRPDQKCENYICVAAI